MRILLFRGLQRLITAPAQPNATEIAVYTALFNGAYDYEMRYKASIYTLHEVSMGRYYRLFRAYFST